MGGLLILISMVTGTVAFISLIQPLPRFWLPTRKRATVVWVASFVLLFIGAGPSPNPTPEELAAQKARNQERVERTVEERAVVAGGQPETETADLAYKLRVIAQPSLGDRETTQRRFEFLLPRLVQLCSDFKTPLKVADVLVGLSTSLKEAGMEQEEGLLDLVNNLFRLSNEVDLLDKLAKIDSRPNKCAEPWAMYITIRREQNAPPEKAIKGVTSIFKSLYSLME